MLREAMGADPDADIPPNDEAVLGFPAADSMGRIYYRTALAYKVSKIRNTGALERLFDIVVHWVNAAEMANQLTLNMQELDEKYEARKLLYVAQVYLGRDNEDVKRELQACTLRLG